MSHRLELFRCPICQQPLARLEQGWCCANGHHFDRAKQGYVNLLPAHKKRSQHPGDNKAMVQARRAFLEQGYYAPLAERVAAMLDAALVTTQTPCCLLDVGCGEGYYSRHVHAHFRNRLTESELQLWGVDIAKAAIQTAARATDQVQFAVASNAELPFPDQCMDGLFKIYAPGYDDEIRRVLKPGACYLSVTPGPRHLYQLKERIYRQVRLHDDVPATPAGFQAAREEQLTYRMQMPRREDIQHLLAMTPFYWSASPAQQQAISALERLETEVDFRIQLFTRDNPNAG